MKKLAEAALLLGVAALAALTFRRCLNYFFSEDDFSFLARVLGLKPQPGPLAPLGARVLSTRLYFRLMKSAFDLDPVPYHAASLALHAANAALVFAVARRMSPSRMTAAIAGAVFASSDIAFTAVFWISGVQDLMASFFMLLSVYIWMRGNDGSKVHVAASAATLGLSLASKESAVLLPLALLGLGVAAGKRARAALPPLTPHFGISAAFLALLALQRQHVPAGGAYETGLSTDLLHNLSTYISWTVDVFTPFKDKVAAIDRNAWRLALPVGAAALGLLFTWRGPLKVKGWACAAWYLSAIAPVLPLLRHTYLYYLYPAAPAAAILFALLTERARARAGGGTGARAFAAAAVTAAAAATVCALGVANVNAREREKLPPDMTLPYDHVLRSAVLARNAVESMAEAPLPDRARVLLISPFEEVETDLAPGLRSRTPLTRATYDVVRAALRDGLVLRLFHPGIDQVRFSYEMKPRYEDHHAFLYDAMGRLRYLGTGADAWANLSSVYLLVLKDPDMAARCARRAIALAPDHPRAHYNLGLVLAQRDSTEAAEAHLAEAAQRARAEWLRRRALEALRELRGRTGK